MMVTGYGLPDDFAEYSEDDAALADAEPAGWVRCPYAPGAALGCPVRALGLRVEAAIGPMMTVTHLLIGECHLHATTEQVAACVAAFFLGDPHGGPAVAQRAVYPVAQRGYVPLGELPGVVGKCLHQAVSIPGMLDATAHKPGAP